VEVNVSKSLDKLHIPQNKIDKKWAARRMLVLRDKEETPRYFQEIKQSYANRERHAKPICRKTNI
jgi:hypothetical protein